MSRKSVDEFIKAINKLDRERSVNEMFRDLMELGYCAFAKLMAAPERAEQLEERYMSIVERYENKDTIRAYPDLLGIAWDAVKEGGIDFLGQVSSELSVLDERNGQFFTPYEVSMFLAQIGLDGLERVIEERGYFTLSEPACGAGGMVLAAADILERMGYNPSLHMLVQAVDVSPLAYYMAYLQLTWRGVSAAVIRGNTLSMEHFEGAWTISAKRFHQTHGHLFDAPEQEQIVEQVYIKPEPEAAPEYDFEFEPIQMALF